MMYERKINLSKQTKIPHHTGGWNFVLKVLSQFHCDYGIFADDIADITFGNSYEYYWKSQWPFYPPTPINKDILDAIKIDFYTSPDNEALRSKQRN
jgi:hypothetical protein